MSVLLRSARCFALVDSAEIGRQPPSGQAHRRARVAVPRRRTSPSENRTEPPEFSVAKIIVPRFAPTVCRDILPLPHQFKGVSRIAFPSISAAEYHGRPPKLELLLERCVAKPKPKSKQNETTARPRSLRWPLWAHPLLFRQHRRLMVSQHLILE